MACRFQILKKVPQNKIPTKCLNNSPDWASCSKTLLMASSTSPIFDVHVLYFLSCGFSQKNQYERNNTQRLIILFRNQEKKNRAGTGSAIQTDVS
jgi:hypothetical protein